MRGRIVPQPDLVVPFADHAPVAHDPAADRRGAALAARRVGEGDRPAHEALVARVLVAVPDTRLFVHPIPHQLGHKPGVAPHAPMAGGGGG